MKTSYRTLILAFVGLMSALLLGLNANAECGYYHPSSLSYDSGHSRMIQPRLLKAGLVLAADDDKDQPTMVGLWKQHWYSKGSEGIPDGTEVEAGYTEWHSDGTEIGISGMRPPMTGDVCVGVWEKVGPRCYKLNHIGMSYDSSGLNLVGPAIIRQNLTLNSKGDEFSGTFTIDQYDESGNILAHVQGTISGTRVTINTGFQKVE
ncbi:MAG: hypothetical protein WA419_03330 [Silvibacterium sp.]